MRETTTAYQIDAMSFLNEVCVALTVFNCPQPPHGCSGPLGTKTCVKKIVFRICRYFIVFFVVDTHAAPALKLALASVLSCVPSGMRWARAFTSPGKPRGYFGMTRDTTRLTDCWKRTVVETGHLSEVHFGPQYCFPSKPPVHLDGGRSCYPFQLRPVSRLID